MTPQISIDEIVIFSTRMDIRDALRKAIQALSQSKLSIFPVVDPDAAIEEIKKNDRSLLIIDWEIGIGSIKKVLEEARKTFKINTRPILMIAKNTSPELMGISYEYHVSKLHTGEISQQNIQGLLAWFSQEEDQNGPLRDVLSNVNKKRVENDWEAATSLLENLGEKLPNHPKVICELAENRIFGEQWEQALSILEPLENHDPPNLRALHLLGRCRMKIGNFEQAAESLQKARLINPFNVDRLILLGNALLHTENIQEAKEAFDEAIEYEPGTSDAIKGKGTCLLLEGEINEALSLLNDINSMKELASVFNSSAILAMRREDFQQGMDLYDTAVKVIQENQHVKSRLYFNKGIGFRRWKKEADAAACFMEAIKFDNKFQKARKNYLFLAKKLGLDIPRDMSQEMPQAKHQNDLSNFDESIGLENALGGEANEDLDIDLDDDMEDETLAFL